MTDIVERLRAAWSDNYVSLRRDAAGEIERLREQNAELLAALRKVDEFLRGERVQPDVAGGPPCHPGAFWICSNTTAGVGIAVCSVCKRPMSNAIARAEGGKA
jgi:hypothetical protein